MRAAVVRRRDLHILDAGMAVTVVVFDTDVRKLNVPVVEWKLTLASPPFNLLGFAIWPTATVPTASIRFLEETLVVALQILLKHDAPHPSAIRHQSFG